MRAVARSLMLMVLVGILVATAIIAGVTALEHDNVITGPTSSTTTVTATRNTTVTTTTSNQVPTGILAVQITDPPDPPNVPAGVSHVYINYSDIEAETTDQYGNPLWTTVANSGVIDLLSVVNVGLTLGSAQVFSGTYSQARFDISNATVTYGDQNYTATVPLDQIMVSFENGGSLVKPNASAGFVIDIAPTILASNSDGNPSFEIVAATQGLSIPSQSWSPSLATEGSTIQNISAQSWWIGPMPIGDNLEVERIPAPEIYADGLLILLNNTGTSPITISGLDVLSNGTQGTQNVSTSTFVTTITTTITETSTIINGKEGYSPASPQATGVSGNSTSTVATFLILTNGQVVQPSPGAAPIPQSEIGLTISPDQEVLLYYLGPINTLNSLTPPYAPQSIIGGQEYTIQIQTPFGSSANFTVYASYSS